MILTVLDDNRQGPCPAEHGLSFLIQDDSTILFDVGPSDIILKNAKALNIDLDKVDTIVLSHGHGDHGDGLAHLSGKTLICHPSCFQKRYRKRDSSYIGLPLTEEQARRKFKLVLSKKPYKVSGNITFLGEIPRLNDFEAKATTFYDDKQQDDFILDDSAIAIRSPKGLIIVAGCSHAGICNIIEHAKRVTNVKKVHAVIGGFHLREIDEVTLKTVSFFQKQVVERCFPSHCTSDMVIERFVEACGAEKLRSGDVVRF
ncbi:MAG: MBL fold metallo-hydrolase [Nanoarchaeota archaeon]